MNAADLARMVETEQARYARKLEDLSTADTIRYRDLFRARMEARQAGGDAWDRFERRYAATLAQGGALADLLDTEAALHQAREWAAHEMEQAA